MVARTTPRRSPPRPAAVLSAPAQGLVPRPVRHLRDGFTLAAAGVAGSGAVSLAGHSQWAVPALVLGVGGGVATVVAGQRTKARHDLHDRLVEALAPYLGVRQLDRRTVRLRSWTRGWPGLPRRILVRYAPGAPDSDPSWRTSIVDVVNARLLGTYRVASHDRLKCRLQSGACRSGRGQ